MEKVYQTYKDRAEFFLVYIREAHPDSVLFTKQEGGVEKLLKIGQTNDLDKRSDAAQMCLTTLGLNIPTLIDREDNKVNKAYGAWPDRLYVVGQDGRIAYAGGPGPGQFKINEVEAWLKKNVAKK